MQRLSSFRCSSPPLFFLCYFSPPPPLCSSRHLTSNLTHIPVTMKGLGGVGAVFIQKRRYRWYRGMEETRELMRKLKLEDLRYQQDWVNIDYNLQVQGAAVEELIDDLPKLLIGVSCGHYILREVALAKIRYMLMFEDFEVSLLVDHGLIPALVKTLVESGHGFHLIRAIQILDNIVSNGTGEHTKEVVEHGAVPALTPLLSHEDDDVKEEAISCLRAVLFQFCRAGGNISLICSVLPALLTLLRKVSQPEDLQLGQMRRILENAANALSLLTLYTPGLPYDKLEQIAPILRRLILLDHEDLQLWVVCNYAVLALANLTKGVTDRIDVMIDGSICETRPEFRIVLHTLSTLGNVFRGSKVQIEDLVGNQILPHLRNFITQDPDEAEISKACAALSVLTAGNKYKLQLVIDANIVPPLLHISQIWSQNRKVVFLVVRAISGATRVGSPQQIPYLVLERCIELFCTHLKCATCWGHACNSESQCRNNTTKALSLEGLKNALRVGEAEKGDGINPYAQRLEGINGFTKMQHLQLDPHVGELATKILRMYGARR